MKFPKQQLTDTERKIYSELSIYRSSTYDGRRKEVKIYHQYDICGDLEIDTRIYGVSNNFGYSWSISFDENELNVPKSLVEYILKWSSKWEKDENEIKFEYLNLK